tara:strand:- start:1536 stop:1835 length:300 start_codon:yes stop_codon:yes gene_type:complete
MQQNKTSDLSESMTEAIDTFIREFLDFLMLYMEGVGKPLQELWPKWSDAQKASVITATRLYGRQKRAEEKEPCPDCELADKLIPGTMEALRKITIRETE